MLRLKIKEEIKRKVLGFPAPYVVKILFFFHKGIWISNMYSPLTCTAFILLLCCVSSWGLSVWRLPEDNLAGYGRRKYPWNKMQWCGFLLMHDNDCYSDYIQNMSSFSLIFIKKSWTQASQRLVQALQRLIEASTKLSRARSGIWLSNLGDNWSDPKIWSLTSNHWGYSQRRRMKKVF